MKLYIILIIYVTCIVMIFAEKKYDDDPKLKEVLLAGMDNYIDSIKVFDAMAIFKKNGYKDDKIDYNESSIIQVSLNDDKIMEIDVNIDKENNFTTEVSKYDGNYIYSYDSKNSRGCLVDKKNVDTDKTLRFSPRFLRDSLLYIKQPNISSKLSSNFKIPDRLNPVTKCGTEIVNDDECYFISVEYSDDNVIMERTYWLNPKINFSIVKTYEVTVFKKSSAIVENDEEKRKKISVKRTIMREFKTFKPSEDGKTYFSRDITTKYLTIGINGNEIFKTETNYHLVNLSVNGNTYGDYTIPKRN